MSDLEFIRALCLSLPDTAEDMPWDDNLCFKVRGKIFTGVVLSDGRFPRLTLKVAAEAFHELLEIEGISIAPYVGRYNWIALANSNVLPANELESLIRQSYELVEAKAPKKKSRKNKVRRRR
jgi:predicted DNA-binding protein (MmcQ/YjbR family)